MAKVSDDHADESTNVEHLAKACRTDGQQSGPPQPRLISAEEVEKHNGRDGELWAVIDSFVVDASEFLNSHPGGLKKLLSTDSTAAGATGRPFGFSFSRGKNAHFPATGKRFSDGVKRYLSGKTSEPVLPPAESEVSNGLPVAPKMGLNV